MLMRLARGVHRAYKVLVSPLLGQRCRFEPYCSDYALEAVEKHGLVKGSGLALWRVLRCNPWCRGGHDPVPQRYSK
ncbi:MAG: membrane protein insertion efficiency factor YidD [Oligoflexia bacterium]|nr:membrane protein insertion efficiency factor YidD [Oligoflexia bacterium]